MSNFSKQTGASVRPDQPSRQQFLSIPADSIYCAYCGVIILPDERRAHTANYFARWGWLHDACENAMARELAAKGSVRSDAS